MVVYLILIYFCSFGARIDAFGTICLAVNGQFGTSSAKWNIKAR